MLVKHQLPAPHREMSPLPFGIVNQNHNDYEEDNAFSINIHLQTDAQLVNEF